MDIYKKELEENESIKDIFSYYFKQISIFIKLAPKGFQQNWKSTSKG